MPQDLFSRKANIKDVPRIVELLLEDDLGQAREDAQNNDAYLKAFKLIDSDPNQYLMAVEKDNQIIATCHLTIMPSLTFQGATRMQIEAVRVAQNYRGQGIGEWMFEKVKEYAKLQDASLLQLSTNSKRERAKHFYEKLGFEASHIGMKMKI
jgi:N-acetylglutamate synthase-like GNAT family acetyltransferase